MFMSTQVLISGGGIGGLLLGYKLAKKGVHVSVVEQMAKASPVYKGELLQPKSLAIFKELGLISKINKEGHKINEIEMIEMDDTDHHIYTQGALSYEELDSIDYALMVPHERLKQLILSEAMDFQHFHYLAPAKLQSYENGRAVVKKGEELIDVDADFYIGAEGRRSPTRDELGVSIKPKKYNHQYLTVTIPRKDSLTEGKIIATHSRFLGLFPLPNGLVRTVYLIKDGEYPQVKKKGLDFIQSEFKELAPELGEYVSELNDWKKIQLMTPISYQASIYGKGRFAIIGDAAHAIHPIAGQGMNLAIQDADVLGELLSSMISTNDESLSLSKYEQVRRRRNEFMIRLSNQSALLYSINNRSFQQLRIKAINNLMNDPLLRYKQMLNISGLGLWKLSAADYLIQSGLVPSRRRNRVQNKQLSKYVFNPANDYPWKYK
ncbi:FAD-dependent oxidoreductase [Bacillus suaedae]|uniref:FAD-dependent monooxygenase n=1 Tax=Halalkalibacter suaedae TaxID=2822140 RepID=A0A941APX9_9BACI|nr:NAD(P)/FAD-dependent oxidoreductase [Bacillus suaedae]MBP3953275.1 FAD-dependent monooxygenase [Bacillus suaedae]